MLPGVLSRTLPHSGIHCVVVNSLIRFEGNTIATIRSRLIGRMSLEGDYRTMRREIAAEPPNFDAVCFHAQQCIEKLLKAQLIERNIPPPYTHIQERMDDLRLLSLYAVGIRYPLEFADRLEAEEAVAACICRIFLYKWVFYHS